MHILRRLVSALVQSLFPLFLFLFVLVSGLVLVLGNPSKVKGIIRGSDVYQSVISSVLQQSQQSGNGDSVDNVPLNNPAVQAALQKAFPPIFLQQQTETAINNTYSWLTARKPTLNIRIDLTQAKTNFASYLGTYLTQRLSALPSCPVSIAPTTFDAFQATCLPPGIDAATTAQTVEQAISNSSSFLPNTVVATSTILNTNNPSTTQALHTVPSLYRWAIRLPFLLGVTCLVIAAAAVAVAIDRRKALRKLGVNVLVAGGFWLATAWLLDHFFQHFTTSLVNSNATRSSAILNSDLARILNLTNAALNHEYLIFGTGLAVLGLLALLLIHFLWHQPKPAEISPPAVPESTSPQLPSIKPEPQDKK